MIRVPTLTTDRLVLRPPVPEDMAASLAFQDTERSRFVGGDQGRFQAWKSFSATLGHWQINGFGLWTVTLKGDGTAIGQVGPFYPEGWPETEIGWMMFEGHEGKGFAFEAATAAIDDARTRLGWTTIVHYIDPANRRSIALAERLGACPDATAAVPFPEKPCLVYRQPEVA